MGGRFQSADWGLPRDIRRFGADIRQFGAYIRRYEAHIRHLEQYIRTFYTYIRKTALWTYADGSPALSMNKVIF